MYNKHKKVIDFFWKKFNFIIPKTYLIKRGINKVLSKNPDETIEGTTLLGIILANEFKRKNYLKNVSEEILFTKFNDFIKNL